MDRDLSTEVIDRTAMEEVQLLVSLQKIGKRQLVIWVFAISSSMLLGNLLASLTKCSLVGSRSH